MEWQPIETAPKDGTILDLWMVNEDGSQYREPNAYWVTDHYDVQTRYKSDGSIDRFTVSRSGWFGPNHDYDGADGWADEPRWFNEHPKQKRWVGCAPTHWMPLPAPPTLDPSQP